MNILAADREISPFTLGRDFVRGFLMSNFASTILLKPMAAERAAVKASIASNTKSNPREKPSLYDRQSADSAKGSANKVCSSFIRRE